MNVISAERDEVVVLGEIVKYFVWVENARVPVSSIQLADEGIDTVKSTLLLISTLIVSPAADTSYLFCVNTIVGVSPA